MTDGRRRNKRKNRRQNRRLEKVLHKAGLGGSVVKTTPEGKHVVWWADFEFPPEIDDRVRYGTGPLFTIIQADEQGYRESASQQAVAEVPSGPEPILRDEERPEILQFAVERMAEIRERFAELGIEDVELKEVVLTQDFPPFHLSVLEGEERRRRTDEEIQAILDDPTVDKLYKEFIKRDLAVLPYFEWVGGSPFSDECWRLKRYFGIRLVIEAFIPTEKVNALLATA